MTRLAHVAVVVPAADEQDTITECLRAIAVAIDVLRSRRPGITVGTLVVLDGCTDRTADIVAGLDVPAVVTAHRSVGRARQAGTLAALARVPAAAERIWTAHTDADSFVPPGWLLGQVQCAELGAKLVLGTVIPDAAGATLARWQAVHRDGDGHPHVHGANFGVGADLLAELGGWPPLRSGEDVVLAERAAAAGVCAVRLGGNPVRTSARRTGRAPRGFSSYLRAQDRDAG